MVAAPSPLHELLEAVRDARTFRMTTCLDLSPGMWLEVGIGSDLMSGGFRSNWMLLTERTVNRSEGRHVAVTGIDDAVRQVVATYPKATLRPDSVAVTVQKGTTTSSKLRPVAVRAWHEALGLPVPTPDEVAEAAKAAKAARQATNEEAIAQIKSGRAGVKAFNARFWEERRELDLSGTDLAGCPLDGVSFGGADLSGADLSGASLKKAEFHGMPAPPRLKGAKLVGADLSGARLGTCRGADADFSRARLRGAWLAHGHYQKARFVGADLDGATMTGSDLRGADFTDAILDDLVLESGKFDEHTRWPIGFRPPAGLDWKGAGPDPRLAPSAAEKAQPKPNDLAGFLMRLNEVTDPAKLNKAMSMLKADRFRLFARVEGDHLVGVVKSQSDPTLVYSCRLDADGSFSCCTQNLNICGGLRGSPCKHLLVLVIGLARAGELGPAKALDWVQSSRGWKPALDKDAMAGILLQYKGAEAGEIDWRPTETIPEDFYAM